MGSEGGLSEAPGRFQRPRDALGARGVSWEQGEQSGSIGSERGGFLRLQEGSRDPGMPLGARGVSWGLPEAPGTFQRPISLPLLQLAP